MWIALVGSLRDKYKSIWRRTLFNQFYHVKLKLTKQAFLFSLNLCVVACSVTHAGNHSCSTHTQIRDAEGLKGGGGLERTGFGFGLIQPNQVQFCICISDVLEGPHVCVLTSNLKSEHHRNIVWYLLNSVPFLWAVVAFSIYFISGIKSCRYISVLVAMQTRKQQLY